MNENTMNKTGFSFNIPNLKKNKPEVWERHRLMLLMVHGDEIPENVFLNELVDKVGRESANEFWFDVMPFMKKLLSGEIPEEEFMETYMKEVKITSIDV